MAVGRSYFHFLLCGGLSLSLKAGHKVKIENPASSSSGSCVLGFHVENPGFKAQEHRLTLNSPPLDSTKNPLPRDLSWIGCQVHEKKENPHPIQRDLG